MDRVIFPMAKARCNQLLNVVTESVVTDSDRRGANTVLSLELFQLVESDQDAIVDLHAKHVFAFFGRVLNHMIIDEGHILTEYGEDK